MSTDPRLTSSSYVVLTLVEHLQPATVYDLKRLAHSSVFNFWALPHTVLYTESTRLAQLGLLHSDQEQGGRRRRRYTLTATGLEALDQWRGVPSAEFLELRDPGLLQLFAGADERKVGDTQLALHQGKLDEYEQLFAALAGTSRLRPGMRLALEAGIGIEREYVRFWTTVTHNGPDTSAPPA